MYVIKPLDIYLICPKSENKVTDTVGNLLCKTSVNIYQLFEMNYLLSIFVTLEPHSQ